MRNNKKFRGFTLIELVAVLVIMAIIALIVTPLVMSIIRKARISADKRSIDAYGRSIELAIAGYLMDKGDFPTSIEQLTIEYSGDEVVCSTTQLNTDSSVYLAGCTVGGRNVDYTYGSDKSPTYTVYNVGDEVTYNNINYYVIKDSSASEETVTLLKAEPLSYEDVQTYSNGTGTQIFEYNGYGRMIYGTTSDYSTSYIKQVVDAWKAAKSPLATEARLITYAELTDLEELMQNETSSGIYDWVYDENYLYFSMTPYNDSPSYVWYAGNGGSSGSGVGDDSVVRPVITISKSSI